MKNSHKVKGKQALDGAKPGQFGHHRIAHYFGKSPMWARTRPYKLSTMRGRFLS